MHHVERSLGRPSPSNHRFALLFTFALLLGGCVRYSRYMHPIAQTRAIAAPPESAVVVFIRPDSRAPGLVQPIVDESGHFLGDMSAESHFAARFVPGHHTFIAWSENTDAVQADLAPGHIYYVKVFIRAGAFSARVHLVAIKPGTEDWGHLAQWLSSTQQLETDSVAGDAMVRTRIVQWADRIRRGIERIAHYAGSDLAAHSLAPGDGV